MQDSTQNNTPNTKASLVANNNKTLIEAQQGKEIKKMAFEWTPEKLALATAGSWLATTPEFVSHNICTDTRKIKQGDIFLAIVGDNFDGHDYIHVAQDAGAVACIVSKNTTASTSTQKHSLPQLLVKDTKLALGDLGRFVREQSKDLKAVAITGSSGKTTTKEMLGSILSTLAPTLVTRGNLNNDLGVPMMLLELEQQHKYAVLELGANHVGEIFYTAQMVKPQVSCVLNIGTAHLGEFGGRDGICTAKSEIFSALTAQDIAVVPLVDDYAKALETNALAHTKNMIYFGMCDDDKNQQTYINSLLFDNAANENTTLITATENICTPNQCHFQLNIATSKTSQKAAVTLNFSGKHNISNALAAAACAYALGVNIATIATGLENAKTPKGRLNHSAFGIHTVIDDTYNSNPSSVIAATNVLIQHKKANATSASEKAVKTILVLGDIGELGNEAQAEHARLGENIANLAIDNTAEIINIDAAANVWVDKLYAVGELMQHCIEKAKIVNQSHTEHFKVAHFANKTDLVNQLKADMVSHENNNEKLVILFKASRFMALETAMQDMMQD